MNILGKLHVYFNVIGVLNDIIVGSKIKSGIVIDNYLKFGPDWIIMCCNGLCENSRIQLQCNYYHQH